MFWNSIHPNSTKKQVTENLRWSVEASFEEYQIFYHKLVHVKKSIHTNRPS